MKRLNQILIFTNLFSLIAVVYLLIDPKEEKSAYFLSASVYNEFDYKKELELDLETSHNTMQQNLDSMERDLRQSMLLAQTVQPTQDELIVLQRKQNTYIEYRDLVETDYQQKVEEYYGLIWDRINGYVKDFGQQQGYQYIFGANGDGSIMYADASSDITEEVIVYINQRYQGE